MIAEEPYQPPEHQIERLVAKHTPRQLAIGYLRAKRLHRQTDLAFKTLDGIGRAEHALRSGDADASLTELQSTLQRLKGSDL